MRHNCDRHSHALLQTAEKLMYVYAARRKQCGSPGPGQCGASCSIDTHELYTSASRHYSTASPFPINNANPSLARSRSRAPLPPPPPSLPPSLLEDPLWVRCHATLHLDRHDRDGATFRTFGSLASAAGGQKHAGSIVESALEHIPANRRDSVGGVGSVCLEVLRPASVCPLSAHDKLKKADKEGQRARR